MGNLGSGREICLYRASATVARPPGSVAASSKEMLGGMCMAMSPLRRMYLAKVPSSGSKSFPNYDQLSILQQTCLSLDSRFKIEGSTSVCHPRNPIPDLEILRHLTPNFNNDPSSLNIPKVSNLQQTLIVSSRSQNSHTGNIQRNS